MPNQESRGQKRYYNARVIHTLLCRMFSEDAFTAYCFDHVSPVYQLFRSTSTPESKAESLFDYYKQNGQLGSLLSFIRRNYPAIYVKFAPYLYSPEVQPETGVIDKEREDRSEADSTHVVDEVSTKVVGFLVAYLTKEGGNATGQTGQTLYQILDTKLASYPAAQEALADLVTAPTDADFQTVLRVQLKKVLSANVDLRTRLQQTLPSASDIDTGKTTIHQMAGDNATQFGQVQGDVKIRRR